MSTVSQEQIDLINRRLEEIEALLVRLKRILATELERTPG